MDNDEIICMDNIYKHFQGVEALSGVSLQVNKNEIVALVGDNGSGKSTLIKILSGIVKPSKGSITVNKKTYTSLNPHKAIDIGISTVYQDLALDNYRDSILNIFLGNEITKFGLINYKAMEEEAQGILAKLDVNIPDLHLPVGYLSGGQRQCVAIARAMRNNANMLMFDEPTAAMGVRETEKTLNIIRKVKENNKSALVISHNLFQVFDIADRVYIIKQGKIIDCVITSESTPEKVHNIIVRAGEN